MNIIKDREDKDESIQDFIKKQLQTNSDVEENNFVNKSVN